MNGRLLLLMPVMLSSAFSEEPNCIPTNYTIRECIPADYSIRQDFILTGGLKIRIEDGYGIVPYPAPASMRLLPLVSSLDLDGDGKNECFVYTYTPIGSGLPIKLEGIPYWQEKNLLELARYGDFLILGSESRQLQISNLLEPQFR